ncbi:hypothetical protein RRG08_051302 [Elysia crispata]|uniref:Transmembrane protein n=1 Tax=Elysia crispata TaxID=231223 RepID=A0AAE1CLE2_9GAST|nr:hypothetical protein RRG08_051302 [Elysia crispata]
MELITVNKCDSEWTCGTKALCIVLAAVAIGFLTAFAVIIAEYFDCVENWEKGLNIFGIIKDGVQLIYIFIFILKKGYRICPCWKKPDPKLKEVPLTEDVSANKGKTGIEGNYNNLPDNQKDNQQNSQQFLPPVAGNPPSGIKAVDWLRTTRKASPGVIDFLELPLHRSYLEEIGRCWKCDIEYQWLETRRVCGELSLDSLGNVNTDIEYQWSETRRVCGELSVDSLGNVYTDIEHQWLETRRVCWELLVDSLGYVNTDIEHQWSETRRVLYSVGSLFRASCIDSEGWVLPPLGALLCAGLDLELAVLIVRVGSCRH